MIRKLRIQNYAIIQDAVIDFPDHLTVITGETGAGKSILLGALNLVLGQRADSRAIGNPESKCIVEAEFLLPDDELKVFLESVDLDFERELIIRREINPQGKSRAFINDTPVTLETLQTISRALIDIHQQFDTLDIYQVSTQLKMIDALAGNKKKLEDYQKIFKSYQETWKLKAEKEAALQQQKLEEEFIRFQFNELEEAQLLEGELKMLEIEQKELIHSTEISEVTAQVVQQITDHEQSVVGQLKDLIKKLDHSKNYFEGLTKISERLNSVLIELEDLSDECAQINEKIEFRPDRLKKIEDRLNALYRLMHKHKVVDADALIRLKVELNTKLVSTDDLAESIQELQKNLQEQEVTLNKLADELHMARTNVIPGFIEKIYALLLPLGMGQTRIQINLLPTEKYNQTGKDEMEFLLSTNKGGAYLPIKNIASGGELARFNLVTKSIVAQAIPLPSLIFDEIDIGISGDVALKMGQILKELARKHQVICITHSPQIASKGDYHYYVFKDESTDRTLAQVKRLNKNERVQAIATMLSSNPPTTSALKNAKELIEIE